MRAGNLDMLLAARERGALPEGAVERRAGVA